MSKNTESKTTDDLNLSKEVLDLAEKLQKEITITADGTIAPDKGLVEKLLPSDLTMEEIKKVQAFSNTLTAASAHAVGTMALPFMKKNDKVDHVHMEKLPFGRDAIRVDTARKTEVGGIGGKSTTQYGWTTVKYTSGSAGTSGALFKRIRDHHAKLGAELFGPK